MAVENRNVLRREFTRIAELTNDAFGTMLEDAAEERQRSKLLEKAYMDWATLLLRYHQAMEGISKDEGASDTSILPMKASL